MLRSLATVVVLLATAAVSFVPQPPRSARPLLRLRAQQKSFGGMRSDGSKLNINSVSNAKRVSAIEDKINAIKRKKLAGGKPKQAPPTESAMEATLAEVAASSSAASAGGDPFDFDDGDAFGFDDGAADDPLAALRTQQAMEAEAADRGPIFEVEDLYKGVMSDAEDFMSGGPKPKRKQ